MQPSAEPHTPLSVRGAGLFDRIDYRRIETAEDKDHLFAMRYRAYLHGGLILPSASRRVSDRYDDAPNAWTFGIYLDGELCSSVRLHVLTSEWRTSYATELFGDVLHPRLDQGEVFVDPARFVADPEKHQRFPELPYVTLRLAYLACEYFNADTGLAVVRAEHQAFYRRVFLHRTIAEPRSFPNVLKKVALMASPFRAQREQVMARFPVMESTHFERQMLFERHRDQPSLVVDLPEFLPSQASISSAV
jgi:N-acyl amino acid synthase FeeM